MDEKVRKMVYEWIELEKQVVREIKDEDYTRFEEVMNAAIERGGVTLEKEGLNEDAQKMLSSMMQFIYACCGDKSVELIMRAKPIIAGSILFTALRLAAGLLTPEETAPGSEGSVPS